MVSLALIAQAAAALALDPADTTAQSVMLGALTRAGVNTNGDPFSRQEIFEGASAAKKAEASAALWNLTNEDMNERPREEYRATCAAFVATHSPDEITQTLQGLTSAVRDAKRADLRRYFQRYAEQVVANEGSDDDRHQEEASDQARRFTDPTDPEEVRKAIDAIEGANNFACLFDLDEYESNFGEIGPPKKKTRSYFNEPEGNDLPSTFRDMLRTVTECLDMDKINRRAAPDRDDCARMLWDRIESELTSSAADEPDRQAWLDKIKAAWPDLDTEGLAEPIYDAAHEDDEDEESDEEEGDSESSAADDIAAAIAPRTASFDDNNEGTP